MHVVRKLVKLEINANFTLLNAKRMHIAVTRECCNANNSTGLAFSSLVKFSTG